MSAAPTTRAISPEEAILIAVRAAAQHYLAQGGQNHTLGAELDGYRAHLFIGTAADQWFGGAYTGADIVLCRFDAGGGVTVAHPDLAQHVDRVVNVIRALT